MDNIKSTNKKEKVLEPRYSDFSINAISEIEIEDYLAKMLSEELQRSNISLFDGLVKLRVGLNYHIDKLSYCLAITELHHIHRIYLQSNTIKKLSIGIGGEIIEIFNVIKGVNKMSNKQILRIIALIIYFTILALLYFTVGWKIFSIIMLIIILTNIGNEIDNCS